jgi:hypothetical protein
MLHQCDVFFRSHPQSITICDADNDVFSSGRSALAWFFKKNVNRRFWFRYVALYWLQEMARAHHWISLRRYCIKYEGDGSIAEMIGIMWYSFMRSLQTLPKRISQKIRIHDRLFAP